MATKMSKRWDSSSRNSLDKDVSGGDSNAVPPDRGNGAPLSIEEENRSLRKRITQLEAENERLKASVFLLTERLNTSKKAEPRLSMDSLLSASALPPAAPSGSSTIPSPQTSAISSGVTNGTVRRTSAEIFVKQSREWTTGDDDSDEGTSEQLLSCRTTMTGHTGAVYACKYSPDGLHLVSTSLDCSVRLWNVAHGTNQIIGQHSQSGSDLVWLGHSKIATASLDMSVKIWDAVKHNSSAALQTFTTSGVALSAASNDSHTVYAGTSAGTIHRYDTRTSERSTEVSGTHTDAAVNALCCGEGVLFSGDAKGRLRAWDLRVARPEELFCVEGKRPISGVTYSGSGYLAVNSYDNAVRIFCKGSSDPVKLLYTLRGHHRSKNWPIRSSFSHPGSPHHPVSQLLLATGSSTNSCYLYGHIPAVPPMVLSSSSTGTTNASASEGTDGSVSLIQQLPGHLGSVYSCDFSPADNHLVTCSADGTLKIWWKRW